MLFLWIVLQVLCILKQKLNKSVQLILHISPNLLAKVNIFDRSNHKGDSLKPLKGLNVALWEMLMQNNVKFCLCPAVQSCPFSQTSSLSCCKQHKIESVLSDCEMLI